MEQSNEAVQPTAEELAALMMQRQAKQDVDEREQGFNSELKALMEKHRVDIFPVVQIAVTPDGPQVTAVLNIAARK